jgi:hypothetical protein
METSTDGQKQPMEGDRLNGFVIVNDKIAFDPGNYEKQD